MSDEKIKARIRNLLSLATKTSSASERESAIAKAHELITKYNIENYEEDGVAFQIVTIPIRAKWRTSLINKISHFYYSTCVFKLNCVDIVGTKLNIEMIEYTYHVASKLILYQANKAGIQKQKKQSFLMGAVIGFINSLKTIQATSEEKALMLTTNKNLDNFLKKNYPHLKTDDEVTTITDSRAGDAGYEAGKSITVRKGVRGDEAPAPLQIGGAA